MSVVVSSIFVITGILFALISFWIWKIENKNPNCNSFISMGIVFLVIGFIVNIVGLWALGLIFVIFGLAGNQKYKNKNDKTC